MKNKEEVTNEIKIFHSPKFGDLRTLEIDGEPWFVGKDVAEALGYKKPLNAIEMHVEKDDSLKQGLTDSLGRKQKAIFINESGMYALIFGSKLDSAKEFKHWVTSEVLPSIRKNGGYIVGQQEMTNDELMAMALSVAQNVLAEREKRIANLQHENSNLVHEKSCLEQRVGELSPKADYTDMVLQSDGLVNVSQIAKDYGMTARKLNAILHDLKIQYKSNGEWLLYAPHQAHGYTHSKTHTYSYGCGKQGSHMHMYWTQKGRLFIYDTLKTKRNILPLMEREHTDETAHNSQK